MSISLRRFFGRDGKGEADLIPPERPSACRPRQPVLEAGPVIDADFREVARLARDCAPQERFAEVPRSPRTTASAPGGKRAAYPGIAGGLARGAGFWTLLLLLSAGSFWLAGGHALAERLTGVSPLAISGVETRIVERAGRQILVVAGRVENRSASDRPTPVVLVEAGRERHAVDVGRGDLAAGEHVSFEGRLDMAQGDARVRISLVDMQAVQSGDELR